MPQRLRNIRLILAYDGGGYHGWQKQPEVPTVQAAVEQAARRALRHQVSIVGAGRTDAGVHAAGQVANFRTDTPIPTDKLKQAIGARLPKDITIVHAHEVHPAFHANRSALRKLYRYRVFNRPGRPVENMVHRYTYHFWQPLDIDAMREAAAAFVGEQDFAAMASRDDSRQTTVRTVTHVLINRHYDEIWFDVIGTGFLYNQVRNMVGTLIEVGRGHWPPQRVREILAGRDRSAAGPTAPARGLCLRWVEYPPHLLRPPAPEEASAGTALDDA